MTAGQAVDEFRREPMTNRMSCHRREGLVGVEELYGWFSQSEKS